jgi:hypothetical protein
MICIFLVGHGKMNFGFDGSGTEPSSVDQLAKSEGKKLDKGKARASSSLLKNSTRGAEATISNRPKKLQEKGPVQAQKALVDKSPPTSIKGDLVVSTSSTPSSSVKESREIGSPFSQAKFPKGTRTRFGWKEGLLANFPDSVGVYLPGHSTIMKSGNKRPAPGELGEYAREAVRAVEPSYFARNIEDFPAALTMAMGNIFEALSLMGRIRDDYVAENPVKRSLESNYRERLLEGSSNWVKSGFESAQG